MKVVVIMMCVNFEFSIEEVIGELVVGEVLIFMLDEGGCLEIM